MNITEFLDKSKSQYHAIKYATDFAAERGFTRLDENASFSVRRGGKYFVVRDGSAAIFFTIGGGAYAYKIIAAHSDSPCFKLKLNAESYGDGCTRLNVERYGGGLLYTWFDRPLKLAGRLCGFKDGKIRSVLYESDDNYVVPSVAIHYRRNANDGFAVNPQTDCRPLYALSSEVGALASNVAKAFDGDIKDCDLYLVSAEKPFVCGDRGTLCCSPRVDNLTSCFAALGAICGADDSDGINVCYIADNEEVGSCTKQGAASRFLADTLRRVNRALDRSEEEFDAALNASFMVSCDNAHATHPNHPEYADGSNKVELGSGIVIKHHANQNYTTDGMSSAIFKTLLDEKKIPHCDFFMRSDLPCGGTLGAISSSQLSVRSIDIGLPQLAMHSACETFALRDYDAMCDGLLAFYSRGIVSLGYDCVELI